MGDHVMREHTTSGCKSHLSILHIPEPLRTSQEQAALEGHLAACARCHAEAGRLTEAIAAFRAEPDPALPVGATEKILARVARDREVSETAANEPQAFQQGEAGGGRAGSGQAVRSWKGFLDRLLGSMGPPRVMFPALAAALLVVVVVPLTLTRDGVREKSPGAGAIRPLVDLQATVERIQPDGSSTLTRVSDGMTMGPEDGLLFQFSVEGVAQVSLVECDPEHHFTVLFDHGTLDPASGGIIPLTDDRGRLLRYVPDGPAGEYVYLAVASPEPFSWNAALLDTVWNRYTDRVLAPLEAGGFSGFAIDALRIRFDPGLEQAPYQAVPDRR